MIGLRGIHARTQIQNWELRNNVFNIWLLHNIHIFCYKYINILVSCHKSHPKGCLIFQYIHIYNIYCTLGIIHWYKIFTVFAANFQTWNLYNSKHLFYIGIHKKTCQIVKLLQHKYVQTLTIVKIIHSKYSPLKSITNILMWPWSLIFIT